MPDHSYKEPMLALRDISMQFGGEVVLRDISLEVLDVVRPGVSQGQVSNWP